jgi:hypothetical protein
MTDSRVAEVIKAAPTFPSGKRIGRPPGSKTRPDAPSKLKGQLLTRQAGLPTGQAGLPTGQAGLPDTDLFGKTPNFERPPEHFAGDGNGPEPSPMDESIPPQDAEYIPPDELPNGAPPEPKSTAESQRPLASMLWDSIINFLAVMVGPFWFPRKQGSNATAGEVPFDERGMVIDALCEYLHSIGMLLLSPGQKLGLAIANYSMPRLFLTIAVLKEKFGKHKAKPGNPANDARFPKDDLKSANPEAQKPQTS